MIQDRVYGYYIGQNKSCAESIFLAANDEYQLGAGPECLKMIGAFSGGTCCGSFCGAVAGGCAAIALRTGPVDLDAHSNPEMREKVKAFVQAFQQAAGSELCRDVKEMYFAEGERCLRTVELAAQILEQYMA